MFDQLQFKAHPIVPGAVQGKYEFHNEWSISVVSGPHGSGLYGILSEGTYEVAIFRPNGNMTEDVFGWNTRAEVGAMMKVLSHL